MGIGYIPYRKLIITTSRVISEGNCDYEVIGNIRRVMIQPSDYFACKIGAEVFLIDKSALKKLFSKKPKKNFTVSIYKRINKELRK